jgi:tetratricopeptide (TPR) repeat protein
MFLAIPPAPRGVYPADWNGGHMAKRASIREEDMEFPSYGVGEGERNPLFLEKRVYQGSSGKVYPLPVVDRVMDEKKPKKWRVVVLENDWLRVWVMPELGGRIQRAYDKTNGYDFVYYNRVIKPALVGLAGPWISGGIEFNWPQHHRPTTFAPVEYSLEERDDGVAIVISEIDKLNGTRMLARYVLPHDSAYLSIEGSLYNRTEQSQSFLWWANPAVSVNDDTRSIFPPDVRAVMDHGKRDVSRFPIAVGTYYKVDYSRGVDISRYRNIPVPTSYMAYKSDYDFIGHYDYGKEAGLLHVADHHVSPGKKQWTWGNGDFGRAWDRNLTDEDGPYIELMTGVFTDNQPDFSWLAPHEEKSFVQTFMPYKGIGAVKNADRDLALALDLDKGELSAGVYSSSPRRGLRIELRGKAASYAELRVDLDPATSWRASFRCDENAEDICLAVYDGEGPLLLSYRPQAEATDAQEVPEPARPIAPPEELPDAEALWLAGRHLEQYRHATFEPEAYYREGLKRYPKDIRLNTAYGELLLGRGLFDEAASALALAVEGLARYNENPADAEPLFYLGTAHRYRGRYAEAESAYAKAAWSAPWQGPAFFELARLALRKGKAEEAADKARLSVDRNAHDSRSRHILAIALRLSGREEEAEKILEESLERDPLDGGALHEAALLGLRPASALDPALRDESLNLAILAGEYAEAGLYKEAVAILDERMGRGACARDPMLRYFRGYWLVLSGDAGNGLESYRLGAKLGPDRVFPSRLEEEIVLRDVLARNPADARARYYLGNLLYDKKRCSEATRLWEECRDQSPSFPTARRNLAIAYFNKEARPDEALRELQAAFDLDQSDARVLLELDQLKKKLGVQPGSRLAYLEAHKNAVEARDDLTAERVLLLNTEGRHSEALELCLGRRFHPWEGGEGLITRQYAEALVGLALEVQRAGRPAEAAELLRRALSFPENLGEGKLFGSRDNDIQYFLGRAEAAAGRKTEARFAYGLAAEGSSVPTSFMYYNDQPPEKIFYQGLALRALGDEDKALGRFHALVDYGERHYRDEPRIDFFAVSLPDFLIFDEDLGRRSRVYCDFLVGLGSLGLGDFREALRRWERALREDPSHQGICAHIKRAKDGDLEVQA